MKNVAILGALVWLAAAGLSAQSAPAAPSAPRHDPAGAGCRATPVAQHRAMLKQVPASAATTPAARSRRRSR